MTGRSDTSLFYIILLITFIGCNVGYTYSITQLSQSVYVTGPHVELTLLCIMTLKMTTQSLSETVMHG